MNEPLEIALDTPQPARNKLSVRIFGRHNIGLTGILYLLPVIVLLVAILLYPICETIYYSFTNWDGVNAGFVGLYNYSHLLQDSYFWRIALNNLLLLISIPIWVFLPLVVALILFQQVKGWRVFRLILFAPTALSWAVIGIVWQFIFSYHGPLNGLFKALGIPAVQWLQNGPSAIIALIITAIWAYLGVGLIIYLAGLSALSVEVLEAARLDGAGAWTLLWKIVVPQLRRYIELFTVLCVIAAFTGMFSLIFVMTGGGPGYSTTTLEYYIYQDAFVNNNYGEACAVAVLLFIAVLTVALIQMRIFRSEE